MSGVCARGRSGVDAPAGFRPVEERLEKDAFSSSRVRSITLTTLANVLGNNEMFCNSGRVVFRSDSAEYAINQRLSIKAHANTARMSPDPDGFIGWLAGSFL